MHPPEYRTHCPILWMVRPVLPYVNEAGGVELRPVRRRRLSTPLYLVAKIFPNWLFYRLQPIARSDGCPIPIGYSR